MNAAADLAALASLHACLRALNGSQALQLEALVQAGCDELPRPGQGATLARWQALAAVAGHDLSLAKLYEGHTDALAILTELDAGALAVPRARWGTWAAEKPGCRVILTPDGRLEGTKVWCSGAAGLTHALLTAWRPGSERPQLVAVALQQPGVRVTADDWQAVGMAATATAAVTFDGAWATPVGAEGAYLVRPGFWQGGAGIAACWYGGARALALALHRATQGHAPEAPATALRLAALGRVDVALGATAALLREGAHWIDAHPESDAGALALRLRQCADQTARAVLDIVGSALGAAPFCLDARFARHAADLPVFIRQGHGPRDDAALGQRVAQFTDAAEGLWKL